MKNDIGTSLHTLLSGDANLQAEFPGGAVRLYHRRAKRNAKLPYLVYRLKLRSAGRPHVINSGSLVLDVWDFDENTTRSGQIVERLKGLLHNRHLDAAETKAVRLFFIDDNDIQTDNEKIWRNSLIFSVRGYDARTASALINR